MKVTRQSRIVVVLLVIAAAGVAGLMFAANQYKKALAGRTAYSAPANPGMRASRQVDGFLAARRAVKGVIDRYRDALPADPEAAHAYRSARIGALVESGMTYDDYASVRRAWRDWGEGRPVEDRALETVFAARREELTAASLGASEALDDTLR